MKYGILGAGNIAHAFSTALKGLNLELEAVASRDMEKANAFKTQYGFKKAYDNYDAMLNDPEVEVVYIATPHSFHYEHVMKCLDFNKHVICEKPLTLNHDSALRLFDHAQSKDLFLMEALWTRFSPLTNHLLTHLESYIGQIKTLHIDFSFKGVYDPNNRLYNKQLGGGALMDVGIYPVTYANLFLGKPKAFETEVTMSKTGVDVSSVITYLYDHATANLTASIETDGTRDAIFIGSKGVLKVPFFWGAETAYLYDLDNQLIKEITFKNQINGYEYEILAFEDAMKQGLKFSKYNRPEDTLEILTQLDQIRERWGFEYPEERGY